MCIYSIMIANWDPINLHSILNIHHCQCPLIIAYLHKCHPHSIIPIVLLLFIHPPPPTVLIASHHCRYHSDMIDLDYFLSPYLKLFNNEVLFIIHYLFSHPK